MNFRRCRGSANQSPHAFQRHRSGLVLLGTEITTAVLFHAFAYSAPPPTVEACPELSELSNASRGIVLRDRPALKPVSKIKVSLPPNEDGDSTSVVFYRGKALDLSRLPETIQGKLREQTQAGKISVYRNGDVVAIVSHQGIFHEDLKNMVPPEATLLGGTRFFVEEKKISLPLNSTSLSKYDGVSVQNRYFDFTPH